MEAPWGCPEKTFFKAPRVSVIQFVSSGSSIDITTKPRAGLAKKSGKSNDNHSRTIENPILTRKCSYNLRKSSSRQTYKPNADGPEDTGVKPKKMKPYKKRSFYNHAQNSDSGMEIENSDDSEKQVSPPPASDDVEKEKDKDKEGEIKNRKKWKRKISRKQFRHHDIKLFTPGEYRSSTFLKQKDPSPTLSKKPDVASKEAITESILNTLTGQKQGFAQKSPRPDELHSPKSNVEENNNVNTTQNHNNVGKHQLPAIIMETPTVRRNLDNVQIPKSANVRKIQPEPAPNLKLAHTSGVVEETVEEARPPIGEAQRLVTDSCNGKTEQNRDGQIQGSPMRKGTRTESMETDAHENVSLKRRYSLELPVDLSKKGSATQTAPVQKDLKMPYEVSTVESAYLPHPMVEPQNPFEQPAVAHNARKEINHVHKPSVYPVHHNGDVAAKSYTDDFVNILKNSLAKSLADPINLPPPYPKDRFPQTEQHNSFSDCVKKIEHLKELLQSLLTQQFNTQVLNFMSYAYQQLETIKEDPRVPPELRWKAERVLLDTYNFISGKFKQFDLDLNPLQVIKILGQSEVYAEKNILQSNLENIQRIRKLDLNDGIQPTSLSHFVPPQDKRVKDFREFPTTVYQNNLIPGYPADHPLTPRVHADVQMSKASDVGEPLRYARMGHAIANDHSMPLIPPGDLPFSGMTSSSLSPYLKNLQLPPPYMKFPMNGLGKAVYLNGATPKEYPLAKTVGRPRHKSHKQTEAAPQLKRSISNPLGFPYGGVVPRLSNSVFFPSDTVPPNLLQNGDLSITPSNGNQKPMAPPAYPEVLFQATKDSNKYRHSFPEYPAKKHAVFNEAVASEYQQAPKTAPAKPQEIHNPIVSKKPAKSLSANYVEDKISSTTDSLGASKTSSNRRNVSLPAVIVADTSMQITKEPPAPSRDQKPSQAEGKGPQMTVIINSNENKSVEKDLEENSSEFHVWLKKLNSNSKLKNKFLSQMGIIKTEDMSASDVCIEISDSDEEKPIELTKTPADSDNVKTLSPEAFSVIKPASPSISQESSSPKPSGGKENNITKIAIPRTLEITPLPPISETLKPKTKPSHKQSLSKIDYIPPIALPYVPTSTEYQGESKKTKYSPEIEPISPVGNEHNFVYPEVTAASKMLPSPITINVGERVHLRENVTSPSYVQKRKTPLGFSDEVISPNRKSAEYPSDNASKRRKSLDRPQITGSPRVAPSGKLCYVREGRMFLRYFDDTQVELFIKNLSSQDEELLRTTGIDPEKIKNSYKHSNFGLEHLSKTEIIHLPRHIEFSRKEDLPDVEEFVKESSLVEQFVPKDFADFYRYVTGFQIIKNKHPVSLQTFLTMYNTNRTTELLRKYLQTRDEESSGIAPNR